MTKKTDEAVSPWMWETKKGNTILLKGGSQMLSIDLKKKAKGTFKIGKSTYDIRNKGYWNPKTVVERKDKPVALLTRNFWDKTASLRFMDGSTFVFHVYHYPILMLVITLDDGTEIGSFELLSSKPATVNFSSKETDTKNEKHLAVFAIGQFVFHGLRKEYPVSIDTDQKKSSKKHTGKSSIKNHPKSQSAKPKKTVEKTKKADDAILKKVVDINN